MKLCYTTLAVQDKTLEQAIAIAKAHHLEGIELRGRDNCHISPDSSKEYIQAARGLIEENSLQIPCITAYTRFATNSMAETMAQIETLKGYIALCQTMKAGTIRTFMGAYPEGFSRSEIEKRIVDGLVLAQEAIGNSGVRLAIETHDSMQSGAQLAPILAKTDERIGVLLDIIHPYDMGEPMEETLALIGKRIYHVHIKDITSTVPGGRIYCSIGEGLLDVKSRVVALNAFGYDGFYSLEWEKSALGFEGISFKNQLNGFTPFIRNCI